MTEYGSRCSPFAAKVPYALAMRMALGSEVPIENDGTFPLARLLSRRPASMAACRTCGMPTSMPSCTNGEFAEWTIASRRSMSP